MGFAKKIGIMYLLMVLPIVSGTVVYAEDASQGTEQSWPEAAPSKGERQSPEEMRQQMEQVMGPMMGMMMGQMMEGMAKSMAKPEVAQGFAAFTRNYYLALVKQGFTEEQAMKIVTSTGFPSMGGKQ